MSGELLQQVADEQSQCLAFDAGRARKVPTATGAWLGAATIRDRGRDQPTDLLGNCDGNETGEHLIGAEGGVRSVLLEGSDWQEDDRRVVLHASLIVRPGHLGN